MLIPAAAIAVDLGATGREFCWYSYYLFSLLTTQDTLYVLCGGGGGQRVNFSCLKRALDEIRALPTHLTRKIIDFSTRPSVTNFYSTNFVKHIDDKNILQRIFISFE